MAEGNYCSRSLRLRTIDPRAPLFDERRLVDVRGEHLAVERGRLMTRNLHKMCTDSRHAKRRRHDVLIDYDSKLDRFPDDASMRWNRHVLPGAEAFPRTLGLLHPLRQAPVATMRLSPLAPGTQDNVLLGGGLLVREGDEDSVDDFDKTGIAQVIRRAASFVGRRDGYLLSLERFVGHLGNPTLDAAAMLQALIKLVVDAPRRVEALVVPVPTGSAFLRLLAPLENFDLAPVRHLGEVGATLMRFDQEGELADASALELHFLLLDVRHMRHTLRLLDQRQSGDPERRLLDTAIVTRRFLKERLATSTPPLTPELADILSPGRKNKD